MEPIDVEGEEKPASLMKVTDEVRPQSCSKSLNLTTKLVNLLLYIALPADWPPAHLE